MIKDLDKKLEFVHLMEEFKYIKRTIFQAKDLDLMEDDAQHSWHLATMVIALHHDYPQLDLKKLLTFAIVHDLPEIYAGDTSIFDKKALETKHEREAAAIKKILDGLDEDNRKFFEKLFDEYENKKSPEARFVYQLDKIQPVMMNILSKGHGWKELKQDYHELREMKYSKIDDEFGLREVLDYYFKLGEEKGYFYYSK